MNRDSYSPGDSRGCRNKAAAMLVGLAALVIVLAGCSTDAEVASENISTAADNFEIPRRVVFFNGFTDTYLLSIEGYCSIEDEGHQLEVTCKIDGKGFKKHFLGLSDNVSYFVEQVKDAGVSTNHYRVTFKPETIIPDIRYEG